MKLSERLYTEIEKIWNQYHSHPFVSGIGDGTLPIEKFRYYMIQDYLYLLDYSKVFALGVVKAKDEETMRFYAKLVNSTLDGEMNIHKSYMKRLNITEEEIKNAKPSLDNISYTNYMLWVASNEGLLELTIAILACAWSYELIGKKLAENPESLKHPFYGEWIEGYSSNEYASGNEMLFHIVDTLGENCTEDAYQHLKEIFVNCSKYEMVFWDMAYETR